MKRAASPPPTDYCEDDELYEAILLSLSKPADALATFTEEMHMAAALTLSQRQNQPPGPFDRLIKLGGSIVADLIVPVLVAHGSWRNLSSFLSVNSHLFTQLYPAVKARHRSQMMKWGRCLKVHRLQALSSRRSQRMAALRTRRESVDLRRGVLCD